MALTYESWNHPDIMHSHFHALVALFSFLISARYVGGRHLFQGAEMDVPHLALDVFQSLSPRELLHFLSTVNTLILSSLGKTPKQIFVCVLSLFAS